MQVLKDKNKIINYIKNHEKEFLLKRTDEGYYSYVNDYIFPNSWEPIYLLIDNIEEQYYHNTYIVYHHKNTFLRLLKFSENILCFDYRYFNENIKNNIKKWNINIIDKMHISSYFKNLNNTLQININHSCDYYEPVISKKYVDIDIRITTDYSNDFGFARRYPNLINLDIFETLFKKENIMSSCLTSFNRFLIVFSFRKNDFAFKHKNMDFIYDVEDIERNTYFLSPGEIDRILKILYLNKKNYNNFIIEKKEREKMKYK